MSFHYEFQKILDLKEKEKEQLQLSLSSSLKALEKEKIRHCELLQKRATLENRLLNKQAETTNIYELLDIYCFQQTLEKHIMHSGQRLLKAEKEVERKIEQVAEKAKEEKSWQMLKRREWLRYKYEEERTEQKNLDEISTNLFIRGYHS